tara:strand:+ start:255 stop:572 length:318 start_codon:yes stop_codon:yes gene_type:complete
MAQVLVIYWRDIPAQVVAETGKGRNRTQEKRELSRRFALAIDEAAMRAGADKSDDYLKDWSRGTPTPCTDMLEYEAENMVSKIEYEINTEKLRALIANGGFKTTE